MRPGVVNVVDQTHEAALAVSSQLVEDADAFSQSVTTAFAELSASDSVAQGATATAVMVIEPYFTGLYALGDKQAVVDKVRALGVPADAVPPGGILEVRTGNDRFQLAADDLN